MYRTPLSALLQRRMAPCRLKISCYSARLVGASRFAAAVVLPFPAVAGVVPLLSAMTASRCRSHGYATTNDLGVAGARKIIQVKRWRIVLSI